MAILNKRFGRFMLAFVCAGIFMLSPEAPAGGFKIQDQSTRAMGMIDAFIGGADDASAVYYNPAGLTNLERPEVISNTYLAHSTIYYSPVKGDEMSSDGKLYLVPSLYYATPLGADKKWSLGIGAYAPFGLGTRWGDDFPPNAIGQRVTLAEIELVNINPSVACQITDKLAVGFGVDYFYSKVYNEYTQIYGPGVEGPVEMEAEGDGWGYNLGLQYDLTDTVLLGLTYRSKVDVDYNGDLDTNGFSPIMDVETEIEYPAIAGAGIYWQATPKLRTEFAVEWTHWSTRESQIYTIGNVEQTPQVIDWEDSWVFMLGGEYELNEKWKLRSGYGYNETPAPRNTADPTLPTDDTHAVSLGAGYKFSKNLTCDVAAVVGYSPEQRLSNPNVPDGDYKAISTFLAVGMNYQF